MRTPVIVLALVVALTFPEQVANKCKGEASFAITACACTVRNRLDAGWAQGKVLFAYYANNQQATVEDVTGVTRILEGLDACSPDLYFMYSREDVRSLGIKQEPSLTVSSGNKAVLFFKRWFRG